MFPSPSIAAQRSVTSSSRIAGLDGLRGLAALMVLTSHLANAGHLPRVLGQGFGLTGVCLFFGLSGFLMGRLYLGTQPDGAALTRFAAQRLGRVLPLYLAVVMLSTAATAAGVASGIAYRIAPGPDLAAHVLALRGTGVLWSIPVELHFYVSFVLLWIGTARLPAVPLWSIAALLYGLSLVLWASGTLTDPYIFPLWASVFLAGTALGAAHTRGSALRLPPRALGLAALVALILLPPEVRRAIGLPVTRPFLDPLTLGLCALLFLGGLTASGPARLLATPLFGWLGQVSFGVYLLHMPVLGAVEAANLGAATAPTVILLTLALAQLSLKWLERPAQLWITRRAPTAPASGQRSSASGSETGPQTAMSRTAPSP